MSQLPREPAGDAPVHVWAAWAKARGIPTQAERIAQELPQPDPNVDQEYLTVAAWFRVTLPAVGDDAEDAARFLRRAARMFTAGGLPGKMAGLYIRAAECLEAGQPVELDARELDAGERRAAADVLTASSRRAMHELDVQGGAVKALQALAFAFDRFAGPDPVRQARERALWRREAAWEPYSSAEPFRAIPQSSR